MYKVKSAHEPSSSHSRSFRDMKGLGILLLLQDGMLVHHMLHPAFHRFPDSFLVAIYTPGWREAP